MTIRSLSHHLALCPAGEVEPQWWVWPTSFKDDETLSVNLLLLPWPEQVRPSDFVPLPDSQFQDLQLPPKFGFFRYAPPAVDLNRVAAWLNLLERAKSLVGDIDGVIFPEAALSAHDLESVREMVLGRNAFLIAGIAGQQDKFKANYVECAFPLGGSRLGVRQRKHHRWRLDRDQIIRYGLGSRLDPNREWWEGIDLTQRQVNFFALTPWLTMCALVCEDLARPDPVAEIVRSIGPNLVVAILQDGPQLASRWSARYASVLADDPGSSVLCLTSIGMAESSRRLEDQKKSRVVALWKDAKSGAVEIALPPATTGIVLNLVSESKEEWAADGRSDGAAASVLVLAGIHFV